VPKRLIRAEALLAIELLALWPVWRWYVHRLSDQSDEAWGIVALVTAVLFAFLRSYHVELRRPETMKTRFALCSNDFSRYVTNKVVTT
jgi:hypothetical protein